MSNGIVEFAGAAGTGKTQVAMWLASRALTRDDDSSVIYVGTEGEFPHKRFKQMASTLQSKRLILERVDSFDALQQWLQTRFPILVNKTRARLLIIDSVGALRSDFDNSETPQRAEVLWKLGYTLKWIIDTHACGVCVTNQVVSVMDTFREQVCCVCFFFVLFFDLFSLSLFLGATCIRSCLEFYCKHTGAIESNTIDLR